MTKLREELDKFWIWASMTPIEYSKKNIGGEWETEYPYWDGIYRNVELEIKSIENTDNKMHLVENILEAMAIDNESENIIGVIEENADIAPLIIKKGCCYYQPEARWQIAELIKRLGLSGEINSLIEMIANDEDKYVQRRALLSLNELSPDEAKKCAMSKLNDSDNYLKSISKKIMGL